MKFRGYFHPPTYSPQIRGYNQEAGAFWIGFIDDEDIAHGMIVIDLSVSTQEADIRNSFASIHVHHDGIKVLQELEKRGFLKYFEEIKASTFYDVVQCCVLSDIPIMYNGGNDYKEMTPRKTYEILYENRVEEVR